MALAVLTLDTTATLTGDEIITRVNAGATTVTRAGSVSATARPIGTDEITSAHIAAGAVTAADMATTAARDNLNAMVDDDRHYVKTRPVTGKHKVFAFQRRADGLVEVEYNDVAES